MTAPYIDTSSKAPHARIAGGSGIQPKGELAVRRRSAALDGAAGQANVYSFEVPII